MRTEARGLGRSRTAFARARLVVISLVLAAAASAESTPDSVQGRCQIQFFATSTKRDFSGSADTRPFSLTWHDDDTYATLAYRGPDTMGVLQARIYDSLRNDQLEADSLFLSKPDLEDVYRFAVGGGS